MKVKFLGTNGWYSDDTGLTPCALIDSEEAYVVLDAGEGIYKLDKYITDNKKPIYLFLSHFHLEHIHGFHILDKFEFKQELNIIGKPGTNELTKQIIAKPFTCPMDKLPYDVRVEEFEEGSYDKPIKFKCILMDHPDPSFSYRFELDGKIITYCTDRGPSDRIVELSKDADLFISECALLPGQKIQKGWSHVNPEQAAKEAKEANAKKLVLMHFDAELYDTREKREKAEESAKKIFKNAIVAMDDMEIEI